jgi:hypothetical protein
MQRVLTGPLVGSDDLEASADEDMVRPVDANVVDLVLAVAYPHYAVDNAPRVIGEGGFSGSIRLGPADDGPVLCW